MESEVTIRLEKAVAAVLQSPSLHRQSVPPCGDTPLRLHEARTRAVRNGRIAVLVAERPTSDVPEGYLVVALSDLPYLVASLYAELIEAGRGRN